MKNCLVIFLMGLSACASLRDSLTLGAITGIAIGASGGAIAATTAKGTGAVRNACVGTSIGLGLGLLYSYFIHKSVEARLGESPTAPSTAEPYYGDLPPNPFELQPKKKREGR